MEILPDAFARRRHVPVPPMDDIALDLPTGGPHTTQVLSPLTQAPALVHDLTGSGPIDYRVAWATQRRVHSEVSDRRRGDTLLLLEHVDVLTAGSRTQPQDLPVDGTPVVDVDRGGRITWHGRGQLVGYLMLRLPHPFDVMAYVRALEDLLIAVCSSCGVRGSRIPGRSGVWVAGPDGRTPDKVAAIGVRVSRGVTMHGFALNCCCQLDWADRIVPCGIADAGVTSLARVTGRTQGVARTAQVVVEQLRATGPASGAPHTSTGARADSPACE